MIGLAQAGVRIIPSSTSANTLMSDFSRISVFGKLNSALYKNLEAATVMCKVRRNPYVRLEHWLWQFFQSSDTDLRLILAHFKLSEQVVITDLTDALDRLPKDSDNIVDMDQAIDSAVERAWVYTTLLFRENSIRSGHLLVALLRTEFLRKELLGISREFGNFSVDQLTETFGEVVDGSKEAGLAAHDGSSVGRSQAIATRDLFISYRRIESQHLTGRIFDHLEQAFGQDRVFKDVDAIPVGARDFAEEIRGQLRTSKVVIAAIGPHWLTASPQRRNAPSSEWSLTLGHAKRQWSAAHTHAHTHDDHPPIHRRRLGQGLPDS